jgi:hypothetical protein
MWIANPKLKLDNPSSATASSNNNDIISSSCACNSTPLILKIQHTQIEQTEVQIVMTFI